MNHLPAAPLLLLTAALVLAGCPDENGVATPDAGHVPDTTNGTEDDADDGPGDLPEVTDLVFEEAEFLVELHSNRRPEATALDQHGEEMEGVFVTWESSDPTVIEISSGGVALGRALGEATLTATADGVEAQWPARVVNPPVAELSVVPANFTLFVDGEVSYTPLARDAFNRPIEEGLVVAWSTADPTVATIDDQGVARAIGVGETQVIAVSDGVEATASLEVVDVEVEYIRIVPQFVAPLFPGEFVQLEGRAYDLEDNEISGVSFSWESSDAAVITVNDGLAVAIGPGEATVTASLGEHTDDLDLEVFFSANQVAAGAGFACAGALGEITCWGADDTSQLAGAELDVDVLDLSLGGGHGCVVDADHQMWCWGRNDHGQTGQPAGAPLTTPTLVASSLNFAAVSAGEAHTCALTTNDQVHCWGANDALQAGHQGAATHEPHQLSGAYTAVAAGSEHTCAIGTNAQGYCWGSNARRQLGGTDSELSGTASPQLVEGGYLFAQISAGAHFTCGRSPSGLPVCWGAGDRGQLGNGQFGDRGVPLVLALGTGVSVSGIFAGDDHACALAGTTTLCWGAGAQGQLGVASTDDQPTPVTMDTTLYFAEISGGDRFHCGRTPNHEVYCWGDSPGQGYEPVELEF